jgi:phage terminase large subunit
LGWYAVKEWLKVYESKDEQTGEVIKTANLKIFDNCRNLIRSIESITKDERDPNDCAVEPHEITHATDALRYWCVMHHSAADMPKVEVDEDEDDKIKNEESWYD